MVPVMRPQLFALAIAAAVLGCDSKKSQTEPPAAKQKADPALQRARAPLTDLTTASSLAPVRTAFNARKGEARFLTLLAPT
jgi:hypothetical protein